MIFSMTSAGPIITGSGPGEINTEPFSLTLEGSNPGMDDCEAHAKSRSEEHITLP